MKIAIVSYFAPPQPAVASHRVLRLTRHLQSEGHTVCWVTLDEQQLLKRDETLQATQPEGVQVFGLGGPNLVDRDARNFPEKILRTFIFKLPDWFAVPDRHVEWTRRLQSQLPRIVKEQGIDVLFVCCGPHGQLWAVPSIRRALPDLKIFVDYRDLLSGNTWRQSKSEKIRQRLQSKERRILAQVDGLFVNTQDAHDKFVATMGDIDGLPVRVMRNAADYDLADEIVEGEAFETGSGVHLGFFGTIFVKRRMRPLLEAMAKLSDATLEKLHLHCWCDAGESKRFLDEDLAAIGDERLTKQVHRHDFVQYGDALRAMRAMDALVLINSPDAADQIFVPGKLYDYLMARRPVLFLGEAGDAWRIVAETTGDDWCFRHDQVAEVTALLEATVEQPPADLAPAANFLPSSSFAPMSEALASISSPR